MNFHSDEVAGYRSATNCLDDETEVNSVIRRLSKRLGLADRR